MTLIQNKKVWALLLGPFCLVLSELFIQTDLDGPAFHLFNIALWMAIWWIFEPVPIAVTALLPIVLFPLFGISEVSVVTSAYGHKYVFLFLGGFLLAIAMEKWNLHKRIALTVISIIGANGPKMLLGFMVATAFLSMWISNTATAVMMLPIAIAVVSRVPESQRLNTGKAIMLGIAYSASIGGTATLIGTPPNLVLAGVVSESLAHDITFLEWVSFALPLALTLLIICYKYLIFKLKIQSDNNPTVKEEISKELKELGNISYEERVVLILFCVTAFCWITRSFLLNRFIEGVDDTLIGMTAGISLFLLPSRSKKLALLNWDDTRKLPWGIILLFGGGMALAGGFRSTGLALWIGEQVASQSFLASFLFLVFVVLSINFLTEITSNLATAAMLLPILAALGFSLGIDPYVLLIAATFSASCAFMLPVATPPNAIVFGSGMIKVSDMIRAGLWMNLISIIIISLFCYFALPYFLNQS